MNKIKIIFSFVFVLGFMPLLNAQISVGGTPPSSNINSLKNDVSFTQMPSLDYKALAKEDEEDKLSNVPPRFGFPFDVDFTLENSGQWETLENGDRIWRLGVECEYAQSINFNFENFFVPKGGIVYIYNEDKSHTIGGFVYENNLPKNQKFGTSLVFGSRVIIEYFEPASAKGEGVLDIAQVVHGYQYIDIAQADEKNYGSSGGCQVNVNCSPDGDNWQDEKKSVALIILNGTRWCTGSLVNNTSADCNPYFLTAHHCIDGTADAITNPNGGTWTFYWNYETPGCTNPATEPSFNSTTGGTVVANGATSDFALFDLTQNPITAGYDVYLNGWNATGSTFSGGAGIHHPAGDVKKISLFSTPIVNGTTACTNDQTWGTVFQHPGGAFSTTEGGSSGSPLYDNNSRVVGQLWYGVSPTCGFGPTCSNPSQDQSHYGKLSYSWTSNGGTPTRQLQPWLDPGNTGAMTLDGVYPPCTSCSNPPSTAILTAPSNGATNEPVSPALTWNAITGTDGATSYDVQVATDAGFSAIVDNATGLTGTSYNPTGLSLGTTYFWRVRGINTCGTGAWSATWSFTTSSTLADCTNLVTGPFGNFDAPACASDCGTPQTAAIEVWANESYLIDGLTIGAEYNFEFCTGYNAATWTDGPANLTVAEYDVANSTVGTVITTVTGCTVTFTATAADIVINIWNTCGAANETVDNGAPTFMCTGNGTALPNCTCSDLIANGDFEAGQDGSWTEFSSNNYDLVVTGAPTTSGTWSTWLGGADNETSIISQNITIDASATSADLTFDFAYTSNEAAADCANDLFEIRFNGNVIGTQGLCPDANSATWIPAAIDLITFAGQSGLLEFEVITDAANTSSVYIDDVVLTECATPSSCPANYMAGNALGGTSPSGSDYESDGGIETTQIIAPGSTTDYDSAIEIWMYPGFHAQAGCEAMAFIDGCNGSGGVVMLADGNYYEVENGSAKSATKYNRKIVAKNSAITNGCKDCIDLIYSNLSAFPNPTNDMTTISFTGAGSKASVEIFDIQGKLVKAIFNGNTSANVTQQVSINTNDLAKGIYVVKLAQTNQKDDFLKLIVK